MALFLVYRSFLSFYSFVNRMQLVILLVTDETLLNINLYILSLLLLLCVLYQIRSSICRIYMRKLLQQQINYNIKLLAALYSTLLFFVHSLLLRSNIYVFLWLYRTLKFLSSRNEKKKMRKEKLTRL